MTSLSNALWKHKHAAVLTISLYFKCSLRIYSQIIKKGDIQEATSGSRGACCSNLPYWHRNCKFWQSLGSLGATHPKKWSHWVTLGVEQRENYWQFAVMIKGQEKRVQKARWHSLCARKHGQMKVLPWRVLSKRSGSGSRSVMMAMRCLGNWSLNQTCGVHSAWEHQQPHQGDSCGCMCLWCC